MQRIILIGPICSGKSSVADELTKRLNMPRCALDDVRFTYYKEMGFREDKQKQIHEQKGFAGVHDYWKPFEAHAVVRTLDDYPSHIIDFGAGHSVYEDRNLFKKVREAMKDEAHVFLLLPSADENESVDVLNERVMNLTTEQAVLNINRHFVRHPSNRRLATHTVYTKYKTIAQVAEEITELMNMK